MLFVRDIHRSPVDSLHKGQWRGFFYIFFELHLNKRLSKQPRRRFSIMMTFIQCLLASYIYFIMYNEVTWKHSLKPLATRLFAQRCSGEQQRNHKIPHYWSCVRRISWFPPQRPVMQKASPWHDVITIPLSPFSLRHWCQCDHQRDKH